MTITTIAISASFAILIIRFLHGITTNINITNVVIIATIIISSILVLISISILARELARTTNI